MRHNKAYIKEFEAKLAVVNEKLVTLETRLKEATSFNDWWPLRQAYNHLLHDKELLLFKINNARQGRNPWGEIITEHTVKTPKK